MFGDRYWDGCCSDKEFMEAFLRHERRKMNPKDAIGKSKSLLHLVPPALLIWVAEVFRFSAPKYGPFNWRGQKVNRSVYLDATMRHLLAMIDGQRVDPESGLPHEAHIGANMAILLDAQSLNMEENDMAYPTGPAPLLLQSLTKEVPSGNETPSGVCGSITVPTDPLRTANSATHRREYVDRGADGSNKIW